tara:strand:- start:339 stop:3878 length:3540 start_codon:yes stop_codon:yes gene_type:complete
MISLESLSQELLPNIYVKNLTLNTDYKTVDSDTDNKGKSIPDNSFSSNLTLSLKFLKNPKFQSELALLLESEMIDLVKIYVHQITSKPDFEELYKDDIINSDGTPTEFAKTVLTQDNSESPFITTKIKSLFEISKNSEFVGSNGLTQLPEELLSDGTALNEIIGEFQFNNIPNDTDFLGYAIIISIKSTAEAGEVDAIYTDTFVSNITREIVILDGQLQNEGLIFTIAPFAAGSDISALSKFGQPGDIWAGGVHIHEGKFMAGPVHNQNPHPFLNYSLVPISKFIDNRVRTKIEKNILNITKTFEKLNSLTSRYKSSANLLDFNEYKNKTFVSDIYLSQDRKGNVEGAFVADKLESLKGNSSYAFLFENAKQLFANDSSSYQEFVNLMMQKSKLINAYVYDGNVTLGTITENQSESRYPKNFYEVKDSDREFIINKNSFIIPRDPKARSSYSSIGFEYFTFKHYISGYELTTKSYSTELEYIDPTIEFVKETIQSLRLSSNSLSSLIDFINKTPPPSFTGASKSNGGFDLVTQRINPDVLNSIKNSGGPEFATVEQNQNIYLKSLLDLPFKNIAIYFYSPEKGLDYKAFENYIKNVSNLNIATLDTLLVVNDFLINLIYKMELSLNSFGIKQTKEQSPNSYGYQLSIGDVKARSSTKAIKIKPLKKSQITIYEYGYDFTGLIDFQKIFGVEYFNGRAKDKFLDISTADYINACIYSFLEIGEVNNINSNFILTNGDIKSVQGLLYSYLNTPALSAEVFKSCIVLPEIVANLSSTEVGPQQVFTSIIKYKNDIFENNSHGINGPLTSGVSLKEDLITLLNAAGTTLPSVNQTQLGIVKEATINPVASDSLVQVGSNSNSVNDLLSATTNIDPQLTANSNNFKVNPSYTRQVVLEANSDISKNNLLSALNNRSIITNVIKNFSFNIEKEIFLPTDQNNFAGEIKAPLHVLCLPGAISKLGGPTANPFKPFDSAENLYISNGIVDPALLSYFWFIHQNIVRVEYLSGYEVAQETVYIKSKDDVYTPGQPKQVVNRSVNKPVWKTLNKNVIDNLAPQRKIMCRLVRYNGKDTLEDGTVVDRSYINKYLSKKLDMPLISSLFTLRKSGEALVPASRINTLRDQGQAQEAIQESEPIGTNSEINQTIASEDVQQDTGNLISDTLAPTLNIPQPLPQTLPPTDSTR